MFPAGAVDDDAGAAQPSAVVAGHDAVGDAFGQTAVIGMTRLERAARCCPTQATERQETTRGSARYPPSRQTSTLTAAGRTLSGGQLICEAKSRLWNCGRNYHYGSATNHGVTAPAGQQQPD